MSSQGWIGVDLDGTLAHYDGWKGADHIGAPIPAMVERVKGWLAEGKTVKVFYGARILPARAYQPLWHCRRQYFPASAGADSCRLHRMA